MLAGKASLAHHVLEGDVGGARHRGRQRSPRRTLGIAGGRQQHREVGALHHLGLVAVVEHGEARRHVGLERKLLQQPGAQRVDGLHLEPAGCVQRAGEQLARRHPQSRVGIGDAGLADCGVKRGIVEGDPVAKRREHPLRHVGGGGLGEGNAQDLFRRDALERPLGETGLGMGCANVEDTDFHAPQLAGKRLVEAAERCLAGAVGRHPGHLALRDYP